MHFKGGIGSIGASLELGSIFLRPLTHCLVGLGDQLPDLSDLLLAVSHCIVEPILILSLRELLETSVALVQLRLNCSQLFLEADFVFVLFLQSFDQVRNLLLLLLLQVLVLFPEFPRLLFLVFKILGHCLRLVDDDLHLLNNFLQLRLLFSVVFLEPGQLFCPFICKHFNCILDLDLGLLQNSIVLFLASQKVLFQLLVSNSLLFNLLDHRSSHLLSLGVNSCSLRFFNLLIFSHKQTLQLDYLPLQVLPLPHQLLELNILCLLSLLYFVDEVIYFVFCLLLYALFMHFDLVQQLLNVGEMFFLVNLNCILDICPCQLQLLLVLLHLDVHFIQSFLQHLFIVFQPFYFVLVLFLLFLKLDYFLIYFFYLSVGPLYFFILGLELVLKLVNIFLHFFIQIFKRAILVFEFLHVLLLFAQLAFQFLYISIGYLQFFLHELHVIIQFCYLGLFGLQIQGRLLVTFVKLLKHRFEFFNLLPRLLFFVGPAFFLILKLCPYGFERLGQRLKLFGFGDVSTLQTFIHLLQVLIVSSQFFDLGLVLSPYRLQSACDDLLVLFDDNRLALLYRLNMLQQLPTFFLLQPHQLAFVELTQLLFDIVALFLPLSFYDDHVVLHFLHQVLVLLNLLLVLSFNSIESFLIITLYFFLVRLQFFVVFTQPQYLFFTFRNFPLGFLLLILGLVQFALKIGVLSAPAGQGFVPASQLGLQGSDCCRQFGDFFLLVSGQLIGAVLDVVDKLGELAILVDQSFLQASHSSPQTSIFSSQAQHLLVQVHGLGNDFLDSIEFKLLQHFIVAHLLDDFVGLESQHRLRQFVGYLFLQVLEG